MMLSLNGLSASQGQYQWILDIVSRVRVGERVETKVGVKAEHEVEGEVDVRVWVRIEVGVTE